MQTVKILLWLTLFIGFIYWGYLASPQKTETVAVRASGAGNLQDVKLLEKKDYGFLLSYPQTWSSEEWDLKTDAKLDRQREGYIWYQARFKSPPGQETKKQLEILIWDNKAGLATPNFLRTFRHEDLNLKLIPLEANFDLGGRPAFRFFQKITGRGIPLVFIFQDKEDKILEIVFEQIDGDKKTAGDYVRILNSLKFF